MNLDDLEPRTDVVALFAVERERLLTLLADLSPADWDKSTPCPGWSVLDLCAHLLGDDLGWLARHRDGHHGTSAPSLSGDAFAVWLDALQAAWVEATRRLSPRLVMDLLRWSSPQVVKVIAHQDASAVTASVSWAGPPPVPVWLDHLRELAEQWIHRQQLLQALGRPSDLRPDLAGPVLDGLRWAYPYRLSAAPFRVGDSVTITITGEVQRTWHLLADSNGWRFAPEPSQRRIATMDMSVEEAWRLLTNNLPAGRQSALRATGDADVLKVLQRTRAIIGLVK